MLVRYNRDVQEPKGVFKLLKEMEATQDIKEAAYKRHHGKQDRQEERKRSGPGRTLQDQGEPASEQGNEGTDNREGHEVRSNTGSRSDGSDM